MDNIKGFAGLEAFLNTFSSNLQADVMQNALLQGAEVLAVQTRDNVPVASGLLRDGIKASSSMVDGVPTASVRATGEHAHIAKWIEYGTAAHVIAATDGKALYFNGAFADKVMNPGMKPHAFMRPALEARAQDAIKAVGEAVKASIK